jgi:hypothetical protein
MGVYERLGARPGPGGGPAPTLGRAPIGSDMIHRPMDQKTVTQHPDRFWTSTCFDDSCRLRYDFNMRPVPLEDLWNFLSKHIKNVSNGVRMRSWRPLQVGPVRIQHSKRVGLDLFPSLGQKWSGCLVEDVGNTWTWSPIYLFGPSCLPRVFNTLFDTRMYFWKG